MENGVEPSDGASPHPEPKHGGLCPARPNTLSEEQLPASHHGSAQQSPTFWRPSVQRKRAVVRGFAGLCLTSRPRRLARRHAIPLFTALAVPARASAEASPPSLTAGELGAAGNGPI